MKYPPDFLQQKLPDMNIGTFDGDSFGISLTARC